MKKEFKESKLLKRLWQGVSEDDFMETLDDLGIDYTWEFQAFETFESISIIEFVKSNTEYSVWFGHKNRKVKKVFIRKIK